MSHAPTKFAAAFIWLTGGTILLLKAGSLLTQALDLRPGEVWTWLVIPAGLLVGSIKTRYIFEPACRRNLDRIAGLEQPRTWQAYRPAFYVALIGMIVLGATLSKLAAGNYAGLTATAVLDFSLATGLLASSRLFWTHR